MKAILTIVILFTTFAFGGIDKSIINSINPQHKKLITKLYSLNRGNYIWVNNPAKLQKLITLLNNKYYNYKNKSFNQEELSQKYYDLTGGVLDSYDKAILDVLATDAYLRLLKFIRIGDVNWALVKKKMKNLRASHDIHAIWEMGIKTMPSAKTILKYVNSGRVNALLYQSVGLKNRYKPYIDALAYYRKIPEFAKVEYGRNIKYGQSDRRVYEIKRRLMILGDFPRNGQMSRYYGKDLYYAIRRFRKRLNLEDGDYIDNKLIAYINLPKSYYIKKIIVNLDKTKLYPSSFEPTFVEVNVPEFKMRLYENGAEVFASDAIVGRLDRPTPIFSDMLEYVVVNPTWNMPQNLIKRDLIPALKRNPNILEIAHIKAYQGGKEVKPNLEKIFKYEHSKKNVPYQFVQKAGEDNALGRVKFMFPNRYSVYLHDTPEKGLFNHRYRYNSSGCMRINNPKGFYDVLKPYLKTNKEIDAIIASEKTTTIHLKRKIPVHIVYFTLEFENGAPKFLYDAYMYDKIIEESTQGNMKSYFEVPAVRLKEVRR